MIANIEITKQIRNTYDNVKGLLSVEQMRQTEIAFTFLRRIDCLIGKYAQECEAFYSENRQRLSDERLDENLTKISGGYPFYNYSGYTVNGILSAKYSIEVVLNSYLQGFSKNVLEILEGLNFKHNVAILMRKSRYLVELFQNFSEIDLSNQSIDNEEFVNLIISQIQYRQEIITRITSTPLALSNIVCRCLLSEYTKKYDEQYTSLYDPTCGSGSMLAIAGLEVKKKIGKNVTLFGQDISEYACALAKILVLFAGNNNSRIKYGNTLVQDMFPIHRFQYILANFPLRATWENVRQTVEHEYYNSNGRFSIGLPSVNDSQFLFIQHIISKMDENGSRAAFISTSSVLKSGNAGSGESHIRTWLFEKDMVETIMSLPVGVFYDVKVPTFLWILSNKKKHKGKVRLINTSMLIEKNSKFSMNDDFVEKVVSEYTSNTDSSISRIFNNEHFGYYEIDVIKKGKKNRIKIALDTDIKKYIQEERKQNPNVTVTVDYQSTEKGYAVEFEKIFKSEEPSILPLEKGTDRLLLEIDTISSLEPIIRKVNNLKNDNSISKKWQKISLNTVAEVFSGVKKPSQTTENGIPYLSVSYLRNKSDNEHYTAKDKYKCTSKDVLIIVRGANCGEIFQGELGILSSSLAAIRCVNKNVIDPKFLYYLLKGYEKTLMSMSKGDYVKNISIHDIRNFKCLIPPSIDEQMRIVSYLDSIVNKIDDIIKTLNSTDNTFTTFRQALIENVVQGKVKIV